MAQQAIGMIETKGLCALFEATDAALKSANVTFTGGRSSVGKYLAKRSPGGRVKTDESIARE